MIKKRCTEFDTYLGQAIRRKRRGLDISQEKLAKMAGVSFQQVQKYEKGTNRISAGRLYEVSRFLEIDVNNLFECFAKKMETNVLTTEPDAINGNNIVMEEIGAGNSQGIESVDMR